jgi:8-oxo-dGTP diphosphatase
MRFNPEKYLNHISLDCVVFGFHENRLKILLLQTGMTKEWALPGGFVEWEETLEEAAKRVLKSRTGVDHVFLHQFHVFSAPDRSRANPIVQDVKRLGRKSNVEWFNNRFISIGFYALVEYTKVVPAPDEFSIACEWKTLSEANSLILDHSLIVQKAREALRYQLQFQPIGYNLLPDKFTMPEFQKLYETILGKKLDRRNFQRKILTYKILNKLEERKTGGAFKSPYLYEFNLANYNKALQEGLKGTW